MRQTIFLLVLAAALSGCGTNHSPDIYATNAVQQANKVDAGIVVGYREVMISANGTTGAVTGGAAGGVLGSQVGTSGFDQALGGVVGTAIGSIIGNTVEHVTGDTKGWEYIIRKGNGDLLSVTQVEAKPLALGQKVLVIAGAQARVVPDYSVDIPGPKPVKAVEEPPKPRQPEDPPKPQATNDAVVPMEKPITVTDLPPLAHRPEPTATELPSASPVVPGAPEGN